MAVKDYSSNVFINCPFDPGFMDIFYAITFSIFDCGFRARCALEEEDGGEVRIIKINNIIAQCKYGIHDISRTELCETTGLPRFNMPLELGLFLGAKRHGDKDQKKKTCLITDKEQYRFQVFISDIAGQDIRPHSDDPENAIRIVCNWLRNSSRRKTIPGGTAIVDRYNEFRVALPELCSASQITEEELNFNDYATLVSAWLNENERVAITR